MRVITVVIIGMFAAGFAFPATAAKKSANVQVAAAPSSWEQCNEQALKQGLAPHQKGHAEYVKDCQAARTPLARPSSGASFEACEARALTLGLPHGQTGHVDYVRQCMGGRPGSRRGL